MLAEVQSDTREVQHVQSAEETEFVIWHRSTGTPVLPLVSRETYDFSEAEYILSQLSEQEKNEAEESFSVYFKPVELYNFLQRRASRNPSFLTKCLHYKLNDKHKRRVQLSVSIRRPLDDGLQTLRIFPLYMVLARPVPATNEQMLQSNCYRFKRACKLIASDGAPTVGSPQARFVLPEMNKLSTEFKSGSLAILFVSFADLVNQTEIDLTKDYTLSPANEGYCLMGNSPIDFIHFSREHLPKISLGETAQFMPNVSLKACFMKLSCSDGEKCLSFQYVHNSGAVEVPITITAEELGAKDIPPPDLHSYSNISTGNLPQVLRPGEVLFNFRYYDNLLEKTEVTEDYTCPFCLLKCASYKGLECHLPASHDLFNYEFWGEGDYQVVNVSVKITASSSEIVGKKLNSGEKAFSFCHKSMRRRKPERKNKIANHAALDSNITGVSERMDRELIAAGVLPAATDIIFSGAEEASQSVPESSIAPTMRQLARSRQLPNEGCSATNQSLLEIRDFVHSRTAQPMALEDVFADKDSEDEVDDDIADLEDRIRLGRFKDVSQHDKRVMHLWNSFRRKQGVLADAHVPGAFEAFSTLHRQEFVMNPPLLMSWNLFMIKLCENALIDAGTMHNCTTILNGDRDDQN